MTLKGLGLPIVKIFSVKSNLGYCFNLPVRGELLQEEKVRGFTIFYVSTQNSIIVASHIFQNHKFKYLLSGAVLSANLLETCSGQSCIRLLVATFL